MLESARRLFNLLPQKNKVAFSSLVSAYVQNHYIEEAVNVFHLLLTDLTIDSFTMSSIPGATVLLNKPKYWDSVTCLQHEIGYTFRCLCWQLTGDDVLKM